MQRSPFQSTIVILDSLLDVPGSKLPDLNRPSIRFWMEDRNGKIETIVDDKRGREWFLGNRY